MKAWLALKRQEVLISDSHLVNINSPGDYDNFLRAKG
jgi:hypothetical protein